MCKWTAVILTIVQDFEKWRGRWNAAYTAPATDIKRCKRPGKSESSSMLRVVASHLGHESPENDIRTRREHLSQFQESPGTTVIGARAREGKVARTDSQ